MNIKRPSHNKHVEATFARPSIHRLRVLSPLLLSVLLLLSTLFISCFGGKKADEHKARVLTAPTPEHPLPDTLRVATLYSPTSYFIYRDNPMGYDYSLISNMVEEKGIAMELIIAGTLADAVEMLNDGKVDIIAYEVPVTSEYQETVIACGPENMTSQVLVQPTGKKHKLIKDVTGLVDRDIYVEANSKYQQRIENLDRELGGGIIIHSVDRDTLITEDLIAMVSSGEIPLTVVDSDIARINKTYYPDLDITLEVGFPQRSAWAVRKTDKWLADSVDVWINAEKPRHDNEDLLKRYFEKSKNISHKGEQLKFKGGQISPYDDLFRKYCKGSGLDWRLMAAIGYVESNFDNEAISWAGARGIMQVMPSTARQYKVDPKELDDPDVSIPLAVKIFSELDKSLASKVPDPEERVKFILASYNAGMGHINDAIALAKKHDKDPQVWYGNVEVALTWKSKAEYYNDPVCRNGYFRSAQTTSYVRDVLDVYDKCRKNIKK